MGHPQLLSGWWYTYPSENIWKSVGIIIPNHQPVMVQQVKHIIFPYWFHGHEKVYPPYFCGCRNPDDLYSIFVFPSPYHEFWGIIMGWSLDLTMNNRYYYNRGNCNIKRVKHASVFPNLVQFRLLLVIGLSPICLCENPNFSLDQFQYLNKSHFAGCIWTACCSSHVDCSPGLGCPTKALLIVSRQNHHSPLQKTVSKNHRPGIKFPNFGPKTVK